MNKTRRLYLTQWTDDASGTFLYPVDKAINSVDYTIGQTIDQAEADMLCDGTEYSVSVTVTPHQRLINNATARRKFRKHLAVTVNAPESRNEEASRRVAEHKAQTGEA